MASYVNDQVNLLNSEVPMMQVELTVSAKNLRDKDVMSKSDPMCILYMKAHNGPYQEVDRTEMIKNSLSPVWIKKFRLNYKFEEKQMMKFCIFDWDTSSDRASEQDSLGSVEFSLGEIMAHQGSKLTKSINNNGGVFVVCGEETQDSKEMIRLTFSAKDLDKKDFMGKSDPFLLFHRQLSDNTFIPVHKTEVVKKNLNPVWQPISMPLSRLCGRDDHSKTIKIECFDWDNDGTHDLIGECQTNLDLLKLGSGPKNAYTLINEKKRAKKHDYKGSGRLILNNASIFSVPSFLDYVRAGLQVHCTVAVDFTASNGDPRSPQSLHYLSPNGENQYSLALTSVLDILQDYDSDKMFPALGFGAKVPPGYTVSHEFFLNGRTDTPYCQGVAGVLQAYRHALTTTGLYGPTNFQPVISHVSRFAEAHSDGRHYFVLLIITDGIITDLVETKRSLVEASDLPVSVIIVGVGEEDFGAMNLLDGDEKRLSHNGVFAKRDIVQFVELRRHFHRDSKSYSKEALAKDVLAEIPSQLLAWMKMKNIPPPALS